MAQEKVLRRNVATAVNLRRRNLERSRQRLHTRAPFRHHEHRRQLINVVTALAQDIDDPGSSATSRSRRAVTTRARGNEGGLSGGDLRFRRRELTSITAYRYYNADQGGTSTTTTVDILYREPDGGVEQRFKTFTQEFRLNGNAFDDKLDWLVGGYYANEDLRSPTICASATNMIASRLAASFHPAVCRQSTIRRRLLPAGGRPQPGLHGPAKVRPAFPRRSTISIR